MARGKSTSSNCTNMELKRELKVASASRIYSSNCTNMELKHDHSQTVISLNANF